jgi:malate permease and related proteins
VIYIALTIIAATWAGLTAERRMPGRAGTGSRRALTLVLYTVLPAVVFLNLVRADLDRDLLVGIALGWVTVVACASVAFAVGSRWLALERPQIGALLCCILVSNSAYLGYPLVAALLGFDDLSDAVAYDVGVGTTSLLIGAFSVGAAFGTKAGETPKQRLRSFFARNIPLYAAGLAVLAPEWMAPDWAVDASRVAIVLMLPVGFFAVGAALAEDEEEAELRLPPPFTRETATVVAIKLMLMPALLFLLALPLIDLPTSFLLLAAMPSGLNAMIVVHTYGLDLKITANALIWTTGIVVPVALVASLL